MPLVKILTHKRPKFEYLLRYMIDNDERLFDSHGKSFVIKHNVRGTAIEDWVKSFKENEKHRLRKRSNSVYLNHEIISFHRDDTKHLTQEKLALLIRQYIKMRNPKGCYVAVPHFDRYHVHVHVCSSAIEYRTGKSMRMSRQELTDLKKNFQHYQIEKFPELSRSVVRHGWRSQTLADSDVQLMGRAGKVSKRTQVRNVIQACRQQSSSPEEFYSLLGKQGMQTYERGGKIYGVLHDQRKYRFNKLLPDALTWEASTSKRHKTKHYRRER